MPAPPRQCQQGGNGPACGFPQSADLRISTVLIARPRKHRARQSEAGARRDHGALVGGVRCGLGIHGREVQRNSALDGISLRGRARRAGNRSAVRKILQARAFLSSGFKRVRVNHDPKARKLRIPTVPEQCFMPGHNPFVAAR